MSEKCYTFTVPVVSYGMRRVFVAAENEQEAREKLIDKDWVDHDDSYDEEEHDWRDIVLDEVEDCEEAA
jgi:hypothetical protein